MQIVPIVEGHGEQEAVPLLIRRIAAEVQAAELEISFPIRISKSKILRKGQIDKTELERVFQLACLKLRERGAVLLLIDGDSDCPAEIGPLLLNTLKSLRPGIHVSVVLAKKEFEAWFLAALPSLRGKRGISASAHFPSDPESISGAKERLRSFIHNQTYSETVDQPALAAQFDLDQARKNSSSFDKLWRELMRIFAECGNQ